MAFNLRHKQRECVIQMLSQNQPLDLSGKVFIVDDVCDKIITPLMQSTDLRREGVTLKLPINRNRGIVHAVAVYFVQPNESNIKRIIEDASTSPSLYHTFDLNFSSYIPRSLLEYLASATLNSGSVGRVSKVQDQYLEFVSLEDNFFSLAQRSTYFQLNDPSATDKEIEEIVEKIATGLLCVLATRNVVPVIRCPRSGPAQMVAFSLEQKLRDHLLCKSNLFTEVGGGFMSSFQQPLLCIFDRSFELSVGIQHDFRYRYLVHDVLGLNLNSLNLPGDKCAKLDSSDPFWSANRSLEFPLVAVEIEILLNKYKKDVEEINRRTAGVSTSAEFNGTDLNSDTKQLMNVVNSLPEFMDRKEVIDKHTNIATALLGGDIKERSLDVYTKKDNDMMMMMRGNIDRSELVSVLKGKGTKMDKLRFAIMYLISLETINQAEVEAVEAALREAEADTSAFQYVKRIKSLNVSLANSTSRSNVIDWAEKLYGQSISAVTARVKNLLSSDQKLAVVRTVEALTEGKPNPETDSYLMLDPRASKSSSSGSSHIKGPFREVIFFMVGGGNYIEYSSLQELSERHEMVKNIVYGATEIFAGTELVEQLALLGQKMGLK